jgi:hypothetical protein
VLLFLFAVPAAALRAAAHRAKRTQTMLLSGVEPGADEVHLLYELAESQLQRQIQREQQQEEGAALIGTKQQQQQQQQQGASSSVPAQPQPQQQQSSVPMCATSQSHLAVMHSQDRNNANNIFGGHLLKLAAELAYSTAVLHSGERAAAHTCFVSQKPCSWDLCTTLCCMESNNTAQVDVAACLACTPACSVQGMMPGL